MASLDRSDDEHAKLMAEYIQSNPEGAGESFESMARIYLDAGERPSMAIVQLLSTAVELLMRTESRDKLRRALESLLEVFEQAHDLQHNHTIPLSEVAVLLTKKKWYVEAVKVHEVIVRVRQKFLGAEHSGTWIAKYSFAEALWKADELEKAANIADQVMTSMRKDSHLAEMEPKVHNKIVGMILSLAGLIALSRNHNKDAVEYLSDALSAAGDTLENVESCVTKLNYGRALARVERHEEAAVLIDQATSLLELELESGFEKMEYTLEVAGQVAGELRQLGFPHLARKLNEKINGLQIRLNKADAVQAVNFVKSLLTQAGGLKQAGRLKEAADTYGQALNLLENKGDEESLKFRAITLDNALGLFVMRRGLDMKTGVIKEPGDDNSIGQFTEEHLIQETESTFLQAFNTNDLNLAIFYGNVAILHSMSSRLKEAQENFDKCFQILATYDPEDYEASTILRKMELEYSNMIRIHGLKTADDKLRIEELLVLDELEIARHGSFSSQRLNQLNLWTGQLFQNGQIDDALSMSKVAIDAAQELLNFVSQKSVAGDYEVVPYEPLTTREAFRVRFMLLSMAFQNAEPIPYHDSDIAYEIDNFEEIYSTSQLTLASSVAAAFSSTSVEKASDRASSLLNEVYTVSETQSALHDGECLVVIPSSEIYFAVIISCSKIGVVSLDINMLSLGFRKATERFMSPFETDDPLLISSLSERIMPKLTPFLENINHVIFALDGALANFPLHLLLWIEDPKERYSQNEHSPRLIDRSAVSIIPSVVSLVKSRDKKDIVSSCSFFGVADPSLGANMGSSLETMQQLEEERDPLDALLQMMGTEGEVELSAISELPQTRAMVRAIARAFGQGDESLLLGSSAAKKQVLELSEQGALRKYSLLCFATHGLTAGELEPLGIKEPALLLSSSNWARAVEENNLTEIQEALLTMSDVSKLDLNAELVLLTACNTSAGSGELYASAFSGLATAFIRAGAKSVLVSYWSASAEATLEFIRRLFEEDKLALPRSEAVRRAMLEVRDKPSGEFDKPGFWATFALIGDGTLPLKEV